jgi:Ni/Co efflux regulator RcnB
MNRLRIMLIGAALITGGSALAQAQVVRQDVAYHEGDRDRRDARDRDDRRAYDRDRGRRVEREVRYDHDRRFENRRWDGHRWQYWNGSAWCY